MSLEIGVIIPTYNRAHFIAETVESVLNQTLAPSEVVIIDDGSTDHTGELVKQRFTNRVRYLRIENSGVCCARNAGLRVSTAPWMAFCDSDDLWKPERLASQAGLLAAAPGVEYVFSNFCYIHNGEWSSRDKFSESSAWLDTLERWRISSECSVIPEPLYGPFLSFGSIFPSAVLMSRARIESMGGFDERWTRTSIEDLDFTLRCLQKPPFGVVRKPLVGIRRHDTNASGNRIRDLVAFVDILNFAKTHHALGPQHADLIDHHVREASIEGAELAFSDRRFEVVKRLLGPLPAGNLPLKARAKRFASMLPMPARTAIANITLAAAATARHIKKLC